MECSLGLKFEKQVYMDKKDANKLQRRYNSTKKQISDQDIKERDIDTPIINIRANFTGIAKAVMQDRGSLRELPSRIEEAGHDAEIEEPKVHQDTYSFECEGMGVSEPICDKSCAFYARGSESKGRKGRK